MASRLGGMLRAHGGTLFLFVMLSASLTLNVILGLQVKASAAAPRTVGVAERARIPELAVFDGAGQAATLNLADRRPTVLYIFSPSCVWCARNIANINALADAKGASFRFVALSNTDKGFREYAAAQSLRFPMFVVNGPAITRSADVAFLKALGATPQTLVVGGDGVVERAWSGAFGSDVQRDVERYFSVSLPGLVDGRPPSPSPPTGE